MLAVLMLGAVRVPAAWTVGPGVQPGGDDRNMGLDDPVRILPDLYSVALDPGHVVAGGMAIAHPAQANPEQAKIEMTGGQRRIVPQGVYGVVMRFAYRPMMVGSRQLADFQDARHPPGDAGVRAAARQHGRAPGSFRK